MIGKYTNQMQVALLLEGNVTSSPLPGLIKQLQTVFNRLGIPLTCPGMSSTYVQMFGPNDLQVTIEFMAGPADHGVFAGTLGSPISTMLVPDAADRIRRHKSHLLVYVQHGVFGGVMGKKVFRACSTTSACTSPDIRLPSFSSGSKSCRLPAKQSARKCL